MASVISSAQGTETVSQAAIVEWIEQLRESAKSAPWSSLLEFDGIDTIDVLLSPIYLSVLNTLRDAPPSNDAPAAKVVLGRAREFAYRCKNAWREMCGAWKPSPTRAVDVLLWSRDLTHTVVLIPIAAELNRQGVSKPFPRLFG